MEVVAAGGEVAGAIYAAVPRIPFRRRQCLAVGIKGCRRLIDARVRPLPLFLDFLRTERLALAQLRVAAEGGEGGDVVGAGEVGLAVVHARNVRRHGPGRQRQGTQGEPQ